MNVYLDSSVLLRILFAEPSPLTIWSQIERPISSELSRIECLRAVDRARRRDRLEDAIVAELRAAVLTMLEAIELIALDPQVQDRAAEPFPTSLRTLDALHLASALAVREQYAPLVFATHDTELGLAARSMGFIVDGVA